MRIMSNSNLVVKCEGLEEMFCLCLDPAGEMDSEDREGLDWIDTKGILMLLCVFDCGVGILSFFALIGLLSALPRINACLTNPIVDTGLGSDECVKDFVLTTLLNSLFSLKASLKDHFKIFEVPINKVSRGPSIV